jgi:hypothetical protein
MKAFLHFIKDITLFGVVLAILVGGVYGVRLPYRNTFTDSGPYQLEAFETGLAFFHYGRGETPFYNLSPLNDYLVINGSRMALLSKEAQEQKTYTVTLTDKKPGAIVDVVQAYWDRLLPWYELEVDGMRIVYITHKTDAGLMIERKIILPKAEMVEQQGMTVWYNTRDIVFEVRTGKVFTYATPSQTQAISQFYGISLEPTLVEEFSWVEASGDIGIINPSRPGWLEVKAGLNQQLLLNRESRLIEVVNPVNRQTSELTSSIMVLGHQAGE